MSKDVNTPKIENRYFVAADLEKNSSKKSKTAFGTGIPTIITVMVVLMLAIFSILSFAQSNSELRLSNMSVETVELYYDADARAQEWLGELSQKGKAGNESALFEIDEKRTLDVEVSVDGRGNIKVLKWQTVVNSEE
jgi:hypothetical protein